MTDNLTGLVQVFGGVTYKTRDPWAIGLLGFASHLDSIILYD